MDNQNQDLKLNRELRGSKRRSRLNLGIATLPDSSSLMRQNGSLGIIEMVCSLEHACSGEKVSNGAGFEDLQAENNAKNNEIVQTEKSQTLGSAATPRLLQTSLNSQIQLSEVLGTDKLEDKNRWKLLRRSKQLLAMRTITPELALRLDLRRDWNLHREVTTVLDCFPSLKHSYSSLRGKKLDGSVGSH